MNGVFGIYRERFSINVNCLNIDRILLDGLCMILIHGIRLNKYETSKVTHGPHLYKIKKKSNNTLFGVLTAHWIKPMSNQFATTSLNAQLL